MISNIVFIVLSAFALMFANANEFFAHGYIFLGLFAIVPIFVLIEYSKNPRHDIFYGIVYSTIVNPLLYFWLSSFQNFSFWALFAISSAYCFYYIPLFVLLGSTRHVPLQFKLPLQILIWTCFEFLKSIGPLGFPWGTLASAGASNLELIQIADFMGMWGMSFILATANVCIAHILVHYCKNKHRNRPYQPLHQQARYKIPIRTGRSRVVSHCIHHLPPALTPVLIIFLCFGYGKFRLAEPLQEIDTLSIHLMQVNQDPWEVDDFSEALQSMQDLSQESFEQNGTPDLLVWPETFLRAPYTPAYQQFYQSNPKDVPFASFLQKSQTTLLSGGVDTLFVNGEQHYYNAAALFNDKAELTGVYRKQHLVPMGEFLPFWNLRAFRWFYKDVLNLRPSWTPGTQAGLLSFVHNKKEIRIGPLICFEDSFSDITRDMHRLGANIFINMSNNSWAGVRSTLEQQFSAARYRSIETRTPLVRLGNNGLTQSIDPYGRVIDQAAPLIQTVLATEVPLYPRKTSFYTRFGDLIMWIFFALCMVYVGLFPRQIKANSF